MIYNSQLVTQKIDFGSLVWGSIRPTDVDLKIDFNGHLVEIEAKFLNKALTQGQKIAMENQIKARKPEWKYLGLVVTHTEDMTGSNAIEIDKCDVSLLISTDSNGWRTVDGLTVKEVIDKWKELHNIKGMGEWN